MWPQDSCCTSFKKNTASGVLDSRPGLAVTHHVTLDYSFLIQDIAKRGSACAVVGDPGLQWDAAQPVMKFCWRLPGLTLGWGPEQMLYSACLCNFCDNHISFALWSWVYSTLHWNWTETWILYVSLVCCVISSLTLHLCEPQLSI